MKKENIEDVELYVSESDMKDNLFEVLHESLYHNMIQNLRDKLIIKYWYNVQSIVINNTSNILRK